MKRLTKDNSTYTKNSQGQALLLLYWFYLLGVITINGEI